MNLLSRAADATLSDVRALRKALAAALEQLPLDRSAIDEMQLVYSELATNTLLHGQPAPRRIGLEVDVYGLWLRSSILDDGGPFRDVMERLEAAKAREIAAHFESGLGLSLVLDVVHHYEYLAGSPNQLNVWRPIAGRKPVALVLDADPLRLAAWVASLRPTVRVLAVPTLERAREFAKQRPIDVLVATGTHCAELARELAAVPTLATDAVDPTRPANETLAHVAAVLRDVAPSPMGGTTAARCPARTTLHSQVVRLPEHEIIVANSSARASPSGPIVQRWSKSGWYRLAVVEELRSRGQAASRMRQVCDLLDGESLLTVGEPAATLDRLSASLASLEASARPVPGIGLLDLAASGAVSLASCTARSAVVIEDSGLPRPIAFCDPVVGHASAYRYRGAELLLGPCEQLVVASEAVFDEPPGPGARPTEWLSDLIRSRATTPAAELGACLESELQRRLACTPRDAVVVIVRPISKPAAP